MTLLNNGNLGIGTTSPSTDLHVNSENAEGSLTLSRDGNNMVSGQGVGSIVFPADYNGTPTNYGKIVTYANALSALRGSIDFKVKSTSGSLLTGLTVCGTSSGANVGIGTATPLVPLQLERTVSSSTSRTAPVNLIYLTSDHPTVGYTGFGTAITHYSRTYQNSTKTEQSKIAFTQQGDSTSTAGSTIDFYTKTLSTGTTAPEFRMRINYNGNVGIGITTPAAKLDVLQETRISYLQGNQYRTRITNTDGNTRILSDGQQCNIIFGTSGNVANATASEKMRLNWEGNLGIGTTSPTGKLSVETNGNHLHLRANTATAGKYWNFDITSDNQLYIVNNGGTGIQVLDNGKVGIGGTPEQKLHVEGRGIFDGGASSDILQIRNDNGSGVFGMTPNLFALDLASTSNFRIRQGSTVPLYLKSDGNLGIGTTNPFAPLQVNGTHSTLNAHFGQGTNNSGGVFGGISLGYSESNALYRKVGIVAQAKGDNSARQDLHFLVDIANDQNSAGIADSKMMIAHDTGYVGIATAAPAAPLHVHGNIQSKEGIISPTFYVARNYGSTSGNFAGYDDITEGDVIDIKDHSIGSLNSFAHGQTDPIINGSSDSIDWNYFRLLFRYTNNSATYTHYSVGFKVARYFYSVGWTENSAEFSGNGMDGARGPRWAVSPWTTTGGTDVPGIGLKYYDSYTHTQTIRVHAIYIQYKS